MSGGDNQIVDLNGAPIFSSGNRLSPGAAAWKAGSFANRELAHWRPALRSADRDMLAEKGIVEGRAHDLSRNNGYARGALQSSRDKVVGAKYRLQIKPDYRVIGIDFDAANEWASAVEHEFMLYAEDPECLIDATRRRTFTQILRECVGTEMLQGEAVMSREWRPSYAGYSTCFRTIEPERLCNPKGAMNTDRLRGGVELDRWGAASAYWVRTRHLSDIFSVVGQFEWDRYPIRNRFGDLNIIHVFEPERPNQTRGFSQFASIIQKMKMMDRFEDLEMEAAIIATTYAMAIRSEFGPRAAQEAIGGFRQQLLDYMGARNEFYGDRDIAFDGVKIPFLFPNESIEFTTPNHPNANADSFHAWMLRHCARGTNTSYEEISGDFSRVTYSSARAAIDISWKYVTGKRAGFVNRLASLMLRAWCDEAIMRGRITPPAGVDYWQNRAALTNAEWIGSGKMVIDDLKAARANQLRIATHESTLSDICADNGDNWEDQIEQAAREQRLMEELNVAPPALPTASGGVGGVGGSGGNGGNGGNGGGHSGVVDDAEDGDGESGNSNGPDQPDRTE
ncbi:phage portal protein [Paraburkholderia tuberum]|uniref:Phage portal protein, lambda family n=1 Tax=Paraburkholderia tuberum TaxID=157910 RepID=A0A1H1JS74_9BURK|nr:phage portal protein [Paraburkholderia tuberum]SDR52871.1 phage portal protein, lambda family [Paraburkholderia tuberum]